MYIDDPVDDDGSFLGIQHLWSTAVRAGQGSPRDVILVEPIPGFIACCHYADSELGTH